MSDVSETTEKRPSFVRRHLFLTAFLGLVGVLLLAAVGGVLYLNNSLGDIERVDVTLDESTRPADDEGEAMTVLLLGTDAGTERNGAGSSILKDAASGDWPRGKYRSDATMVVHIPADRESAVLMSIPRDSYVPIFDETGQDTGRNKINSALSLYGPSGAIATVENLTGLRMDHVAMVDWDGFESITDALGGVEMTTDEGTRTYDGAEALAYVRERYTVAGGDFGRVQRQQNFLRAVMNQALDRGTLSSPNTLRKTLGAVTKNVAVDDEWGNRELATFAYSMRGLRPGAVTFMTVPYTGTDTVPDAGSIVRLDQRAGDQLYAAVADDQLQQFLDQNPELLLPDAASVD